MSSERTIKPVHPGEVLSDILEDLDLTPTQFAEILNVSGQIVNEIVHGQRPVTVDIAIPMGRALGNGPRL